MQLARKLQQKELLREHKRKMEGVPTPMEDSPSATPMEVPASVSEPTPAEKPHKVSAPVTPQKLILPKCTSTPPASTGVVVPTQAPAVASTAGPQQQSILVISPTPHIKPQGLGSVVILSPVTQQRPGRGVIPPVSRTQSMGLSEVRVSQPGMLRQQSAPATAILAQPAGTQVQTLAQALAQVTPAPTAVTLPVTALGQPLSTAPTRVLTQVVPQQRASLSQPASTPNNSAPSQAHLSSGSSMVRTLLTSGPPPPVDRHAPATTASSAFVPFEAAVVSPASQPPMPKSLEAALTANLDDPAVKAEPAGEMAALNISSNSNDSLTMNSDSNDGMNSTPSSASATPSLLSPSGGLTPDCKQRDRACGARNKISSKTVSSLLKEQRGYGPIGDQNAPYVNDRRPVATLLRESRQRRGSGGQPILISPDSATNTPIMSPQTVLPTNPPAIQPRPSQGPLLVTQPNNPSQVLMQQPGTVNLVPGNSTNLSDLKTLLQASSKPAVQKPQLDSEVNVVSMERDALQDFFGSNLSELQDITRMIESGEVDTLPDITSGAVASQPPPQGTTLLLDQVNATLRAQLTNNNSPPNFSSPPTIKRLLSTKSGLAGQPGVATSQSVLPRQMAPVQLTLASQQPMVTMALHQSNQLANNQQLINQQAAQINFNQAAHQQNLQVAGNDHTSAQRLMWLAQQSAAAGKKQQSQQLMQLANLTQNNINVVQAPLLASQTQQLDPMQLQAELRQAALFRPVTQQDGSMPPSPAVLPGSGMVSPANSMPPSPLVVGSNNSSMPPSPMMSPQQSGFAQPAGSQSSLSSVGLSGLTIRERLAQKLKVLPDMKRDNTHFAPASSIRPVKRGCRSSKATNSKRQRHHSAHSALGGTKPQPAPLLAPNLHQQMAALQHNDLSLDPQRHLANSDNNLNMAAPQSPFSPEMADIFGSAAGVPQPSSAMFRSQSVPASDMFCSDSDNQELFAMASSLLDQQDILGNGATNDLATLLQEKLEPPSQPDNRGLHTNSEDYTAKRNLNDILEFQNPGQSGLDADLQDNSSLLRFTRKGDMTLTSASLYGQAAMMPDMTQQTPPASQTTTPDYSQDMTSGTVISLPHQASSANLILTHALDTPSSLDALSGQDSRESMAEQLFSGIYDAHAPDMGSDMTANNNAMDMITNNDFSFGQWEMPQIAQDGVWFRSCS